MNNDITKMTQRDAFWTKVYDIAINNRDVVVVSADMGAPALDQFRKDYASQFVNAGISEQNAILVSTGLALSGKKVFVYAIAPFITLRVLEQIRVNNAIMKVPITIVGVGAGFGYEDSGPTHHIIEDIAALRCLPDIKIHSVSDSVMAAAVAGMSCKMKKTNYVRLDRLVLPKLYDESEDFSKGFSILREGANYIIATGSMVHVALEACDILNKKGVDVGVIDVYTIPIEEKLLIGVVKNSDWLVTLEEHFLPGGMGSAICEFLQNNEAQIPVKRLGLTHEKGYCYEYGGRDLIRKFYGIDTKNVVEAVGKFAERKQGAGA